MHTSAEVSLDPAQKGEPQTVLIKWRGGGATTTLEFPFGLAVHLKLGGKEVLLGHCGMCLSLDSGVYLDSWVACCSLRKLVLTSEALYAFHDGKRRMMREIKWQQQPAHAEHREQSALYQEIYSL